MKKRVVGLLLVAVGLLVAGCGGATSTSTTSTSTSPSPSPSPSPTVLTNADLLTKFLADVKPVRLRYKNLERRLNHVIWSGDVAHPTLDSTWAPAGRKVGKLTNEYDGIMVDLQVVDVPAFMRPAMMSLLKGLRIERKMYDRVGNWFVNKESWGGSTSNGKLFDKLHSDYGEALNAWVIKVKLEAKRLGVKVPWKWTKPSPP